MRKILLAPLALAAVFAGGAARIVQDQCGPFTDVTPAFCPYILELYYLGITAGTSPTTFSPDDPLTRGQGAVFIAKGLNQSLARSSRRAALGQWWTTTPQWNLGLGVTTDLTFPGQVAVDGADIWVPQYEGKVARVRASDGRILETWTGMGLFAVAATSAMGRIYVAALAPNDLYEIDPAAPAGQASAVAFRVAPAGPQAIAFDGSRFWVTACCYAWAPPPFPPPNSVSIVTPGTWEVTTLTDGFENPYGLVFDGKDMWVTDVTKNAILRLDSSGSVTQAVVVGALPRRPVFDGSNIWVPTTDSLTVLRAATGDVVATLTGNGLVLPEALAFDGARVLALNREGGLSLWDAQSLAPLGHWESGFRFGSSAVSDGINFWLSLQTETLAGALARF